MADINVTIEDAQPINVSLGEAVNVYEEGTGDYNDLNNLPDLTLKADKSDTYTKIEVDTSLAGKAELVHVHAISDVTGLQTALNAKANASDTVNLTGDQTIAGTKTFSSALITQSGTSIGGVLHLTGVGFPNGVVSAPVGSKYIDTAATNGALEWMKASGVGNTGWVVSVGDDTASKLYVQSRGQNLVTNGTGLLGNNYNFSGFSFDPTEVYAGGGSFKSATYSAAIKTDELIPVDPNGQYELSLYAKATTYVAGAKFYSGLSPYDIDGNSISPYNYMKYAGSTDTTLASNLNPGDTTITLTDATGWSNGSIVYSRNIAWYGYTNSKGYTYPDYTYTRNVSSTLPDNNNHGLWSSGGISGNTITLRNPWNGPAIPAGKAVRNTTLGGSYKYIGAVGVNVPSAWTKYSGITTGVDESGAGVYSKLPYGTAYVRLVFLPNYNGAGNVTNISNITFTKTGEDIVLTSPNGTLYRVNVSDAGVLSAGAV